MAQKTIATQAQIGDFKDVLSLLAENLNAHVNHSLSKAHGIDLVSGYTDADGNDLTAYRNGHGDIIGNIFVRFAIEGVLYYAPATATALGGQDSSTGSLPTNPDVATSLTVPSPATLITDYGSIEIQQAENVDSLLLEHTRQNHDVVHSKNSRMTVLAKNTFDSNGHLVGRFVILFIVNGVEYEIPCDTRFGGPPQAPRLGAYNPSSFSTHGGGTVNLSYTATPVLLGGTKPITFSFEYYNTDGATWSPVPGPENTDVAIPWWQSTDGDHGSILSKWHSDTGSFLFEHTNPADNTRTRIRVTATGPGGTTHTIDGTTSDAIFEMDVNEDEPGMCFFFKVALNWNIPDFLELDAKREFYTLERQRGYKWMCHWGVPLMDRSKVFFSLIRLGIVVPFLQWGAFRYRQANRTGWLFAWYCRVWLLIWKLIGKAVGRDVGKPPGWKTRLDNHLHPEQ